MSSAPVSPELSPLRRALIALEQSQEKLAAADHARSEPIAVIGLGCRFPGSPDPAAFWAALDAGRDLVTEIPADRWRVDDYYDADPDTPGKMSTRWGGFLDGIDQFDPEFFGISPREAVAMDPQQRLLLEVAWEALEHAGQGAAELSNGGTGVFVGLTSDEYAERVRTAGDLARFDAYYASGIARSVAAGRISYTLGIAGPNLAIDTACSSSLVAVHMACQSLRTNECRMALAGGANVILSPTTTIAFSKSHMMAADGRCKTFDARADGFVRAEGAGLVVLKRLSHARADGDRVLAVIRGSAINQDGRSSGLTVPSRQAQEAVIRQALAVGGVDPLDVSYVEAHGTGTALGDPIEAQALAAALGAGRGGDNPLVVGSLKTNAGHLESAAGVAGLIKVILALQAGRIPRHLHFREMNPHIQWGGMPVEIPVAGRAWPAGARRRVAGVSAFGFSGTNAHVVVEEAPRDVSPAVDGETTDRATDHDGASGTAHVEPPTHLLTLSARTPEALDTLVTRYVSALESTDAAVADVCFTASAGRMHHSERLAVVGATRTELRDRLRDGACIRGQAGRDSGRVAFLFSGQGAQWAGMGREADAREPVFRGALDRAAAALGPHVAVPLREALWGPAAARHLADTAVAQPALVALAWALAALWRAWGVVPGAVLGHSVGEYAALCVAGVWTLEDTLALVAARGRAMAALGPGWGMTAVQGPRAAVGPALGVGPLSGGPLGVGPLGGGPLRGAGPDAAAWAGAGLGGVGVAARNGPGHLVLSGPVGALAVAEERLGAAGLGTRRLAVGQGFHSAQMEAMADAFAARAAGLPRGVATATVVSSVTGAWVAGGVLGTAGYWRRQVREAVAFEEGLGTLAGAGYRTFLEVGPGGTLVGLGRAALAAADADAVADTAAAGHGGGAGGAGAGRQWATSLRAGRGAGATLRAGAGRLYVAGVGVDWGAVDGRAAGARRRVALPTYPFQRQRYWPDFAPSAPPSRTATSAHPMLGDRVAVAGTPGTAIWQATLSVTTHPFLADHQVQGRVIVPMTGYLEMFVVAASSPAIDNVTLREPLEIPDGATITIQVQQRDAALTMYRQDESGEWTLIAQAEVGGARTAPEAESLADLKTRVRDDVPPANFYADVAARGVAFGPAFRGLKRLTTAPGEALGAIDVPDVLTGERARYRFHPAQLDACVQTIAAALGGDDRTLYLPASVDRFSVYAAPDRQVWAHAAVRPNGGSGGARAGDVWVYDEGGALLAAIEGLVLRPAASAAPADCLFELDWEPSDAHESRLPPPAQIAAVMRGRGDELLLAHGMNRYEALRPQLDGACRAYVLAALAELGWRPRSGDRTTTAALAERLAVAAPQRQLLAQMLGWLAEDGVLSREDGTWVTRVGGAPDRTLESASALADLGREYPEFETELALTARCGADLAGVLRGTTDPLELLFPGGSLETAEKLYTESAGALAFNGLVRDAVAHAVGRWPAPETLQVLEIGGGTGGTTAHVAPVLSADRVAYTFTDVSPLFVAKARERFARFPFLQYGVLDIERDPAAQGYAAGQYDLIFASNVLHATRDLRATLERVHALLAPGGTLVLLEVTRPERWIDLTFGMTEGWWSFRDHALRPSHALLDATQWLALLGKFGDAAAIETTVAAWNTVFFLQKAAVTPAVTGDWLILADRGGVGDALAARLDAAGAACTVLRAPAPLDVASRRWRGVVHLWALDAAPADALDDEHLAQAQRLVCDSTLDLVRGLTDGEPAPLWLVTRGAQAIAGDSSAIAVAQAPLPALARTVAYEHPELACRYVDLDPTAAAPAEALWNEIRSGGESRQVALRGNTRHRARVQRIAPTHDGARLRLTIPHRGRLDNVRAEPAQRRTPAAGEVEICVDASGVTFRDVLNVLDLYPGDAGPLGGECAGRITRVGAGVTGVQVGDAVVAVAPGSHDGYVIARSALVASRPASLSSEDAITIPISYLTAIYTLDHLAGVRAGERVLVHAATGGVGLAAVHVARRAGAEVFATAGSEAKRAYLRALGVRHVYDSRSITFAEQILADTGGAGVEVVLNSLADDFASASFRAIARGGRFLEIGKRGIWTHDQARALGRDIAYHIVDWGEVAERDPALIGGMLREIMVAAARGEIRPLPARTFAVRDPVSALRYVAQARHVGKVVLRQPGVDVRVVADATYLVVGGLGALGLRCARWLVDRGARHLVLAGRSAATAAADREIDALRAAGAQVVTAQADVARAADVAMLLDRMAGGMPPLRGVLHAAGALADGTMRQLDPDTFSRALAPKVNGSWHLHQHTRAMPLDFFVLFSSVASVLGAPGQSNHAAANAFEDALAHARRAEGLPAVSINWGAWDELGAAVRPDLAQRRSKIGLGALTPNEALALLERILRDDPAQVAAARMDWPRFAAQSPTGVDWLGSVVATSRDAPVAAEQPPVAPSIGLTERLRAAPEAQRAELLREHLEGIARAVLGVAAGRRIDPAQPLQELGLDSLMAVEFRNALAAAVGRSLPSTLLFSYPALDDIAAFLARDVLGWTAPPAGAAPATAPVPNDDGVLGAIESLSDEEVERLFAQQLGGRVT